MVTKAEIKYVSDKTGFETAKALFKEYANELGVDLCFQNFEDELANIDRQYSPEAGGIYILYENEQLAGCIALRKFSDGVGEVKRLYIRQQYRSNGYGKVLVEKIISLAKQVGYKTLRLDTLDTMVPAIRLYNKYGFVEIEKYRENPFSDARFFELRLL